MSARGLLLCLVENCGRATEKTYAAERRVNDDPAAERDPDCGPLVERNPNRGLPIRNTPGDPDYQRGRNWQAREDRYLAVQVASDDPITAQASNSDGKTVPERCRSLEGIGRGWSFFFVYSYSHEA
jgi:hypothetical protein